MKTASDIQNLVKNMRYYSQEIDKKVKQQFEEDISSGDINTQVGSTRFDALGAIGAACHWIGIYCDNIESNLATAVKQDKLLHTEEQEVLF